MHNNTPCHLPDAKLKLSVTISTDIKWEALLGGEPVVLPSPVSLTINGKELGKNPVVTKVQEHRVNNTINAEIARKSKIVSDNYNELIIQFKNKYALILRVYNDGIAYRFRIELGRDTVIINSESLKINFPGDTRALFPEEESILSDNERPYKENTLSGFSATQFCSLPMLANNKNNIRILITDADLLDYPNLFLSATGSNSLQSKFPPVVLEAVPAERDGDRMERITKEADYITKTTGNRTLPWRVFTITNDDRKLAESDLRL